MSTRVTRDEIDGGITNLVFDDGNRERPPWRCCSNTVVLLEFFRSLVSKYATHRMEYTYGVKGGTERFTPPPSPPHTHTRTQPSTPTSAYRSGLKCTVFAKDTLSTVPPTLAPHQPPSWSPTPLRSPHAPSNKLKLHKLKLKPLLTHTRTHTQALFTSLLFIPLS